MKRLVARLGKILEWKAVYLTGNTTGCEERADEFLSSVVRTGITDHPAGDIRRDGAKTAFQIRHLILDNHIKAEGAAVPHHLLPTIDPSRDARIICWKLSRRRCVSDHLAN
jgi:hypothetical protein